MRIALRLAVLIGAAFSATLFMAAGALGSASLGLEPGGAIRAVSVGRVTFTGSGLSVECNASLNGEVAGGVSKSGARSTEGLTGILEEGRFAECRESFGAAEVRSLLTPSARSELIYSSFLGTLPSITGVLLTAQELTMQIRGLITCLYRGEVGLLVTFPAEAEGNRARILEASRIPLVSGSETCPREGSIRGTLRITPSQRITLRTEALRSNEITGSGSSERGVQTLLLTAGFGLPIRIRAFIDAPTEGRVRIDAEARCRQWLFWRERCAVTITGVNSPASGELIVEYISGAIVKELRSPYIRL
jgi:hypothetical protein